MSDEHVNGKEHAGENDKQNYKEKSKDIVKKNAKPVNENAQGNPNENANENAEGNPRGKLEDRREAANRLMDAITDLSDEIILTADKDTEKDVEKDAEERSADTRSSDSGSRKKASESGKNRRTWITIGAIAAAALLAGLISMGVYLGRSSKEDGSISADTQKEKRETESNFAVTEAAVTEAYLPGTEAGVTEQAKTENSELTDTQAEISSSTEEVRTEAETEAETGTEADTGRPATEASVRENAVHVIGAEGRPGMEVKTVSFESLSEMEEYADVILRAVRLDREEPYIERYADATASSTFMISGWTFSEVKIGKIYKDTTDQLAEGKTITILENEVYDELSNMVYHIGGYDMMVKGYEYLLFLKKNVMDDGTVYYVSCGVNFGTVSTANDGRYKNLKYQNAKDGIDLSIYRKIWEDALKKYPEDSQS